MNYLMHHCRVCEGKCLKLHTRAYCACISADVHRSQRMEATVAAGKRPLPGLQPGPAWKPAAQLAGFLAQRYVWCVHPPCREMKLSDLILSDFLQSKCSVLSAVGNLSVHDKWWRMQPGISFGMLTSLFPQRWFINTRSGLWVQEYKSDSI